MTPTSTQSTASSAGNLCSLSVTSEREDFTFKQFEVRLQDPSPTAHCYVLDQQCPFCWDICVIPSTVCEQPDHLGCKSCQERNITLAPEHCGRGCRISRKTPLPVTALSKNNSTVPVACPFSSECGATVKLDRLIAFASSNGRPVRQFCR